MTAIEHTGVTETQVRKTGIFAKLVGAICFMSALGLWLAPGSDWAPETALIKLGLSAILMFGGGVFYLSGDSKKK